MYYNNYKDISDLPMHIFEEMRHFFTVYKNLENKTTAVDEVMARTDAVKVIESAIENYKEKFV